MPMNVLEIRWLWPLQPAQRKTAARAKPDSNIALLSIINVFKIT